jgi:hypothetical protein
MVQRWNVLMASPYLNRGPEPDKLPQPSRSSALARALAQ